MGSCLSTAKSKDAILPSSSPVVQARTNRYRLSPGVREHLDAEHLFKLTNKNASFSAIKKAGERFFHRDTLQCAEREYKRSGDNTLLSKALEAGLKKRSRIVHPSEKLNAIEIFHKFPLHANSHKTPLHWDSQCDTYTIFDIEAAEIYARKHSRSLERKVKTFDRLAKTSNDGGIRKLSQKIADRTAKPLVDLEHLQTHINGWQVSKHSDVTGNLPAAVASSLKAKAHASKAFKYSSRYGAKEKYLTDPQQNAREHSEFHHRDTRHASSDLSHFMENVLKQRTLAQAGASGRSFS